MNKVLLTFILLIFLSSCSHIKRKSFNESDNIKLYELLKNQIQQYKASDLKECNCMKAFHRNFFHKPNGTARYIFDQKVGEHAVEIANKDTLNVLAIGSGALLNELSAFSNILARHKNLNIYLIDYVYVFYGDDDCKKKAISFGKNPKRIPEKWQGFHFWDLYQNNKATYLKLFENNHAAIEQFKIIIKNVASHYNTKVNIYILKPPTEQAINLPHIDIIIAIDAFMDVPNLMWTLFYEIKINNQKPTRFIALNKAKPLGGFWDSSDGSKKDENLLKPVTIDIYDLESTRNYGSYKLIEKITFKATQEQIDESISSIKKSKGDSTQSPFDMN